MSSVRSWVFRTRAKIRSLRHQADRLRDQRDWNGAAAAYERVLSMVPRDAAMHVQAGHMRKEAGDHDRAEAHYLRAKALIPDDVDLNLQLGHFYKINKRPLEAHVAYRQALMLAPDDEDVRREFAEMARQVRVSMGASDEIDELRVAKTLAKLADSLTIEDVRGSGLFDRAWYLRKNPDIAKLGVDPLLHFFEYGRAEGRRPGPGFEPDWYAVAYPEAPGSGLDLFTHYMVVGREEGLRPAGPPMYERWVRRFDTLSAIDLDQIDAHIAELRLPRPEIILSVTPATASFLSAAVRGLRGQRLRPARVTLCIDDACGDAVATAAAKAVGADDLFRIASREAADVAAIEAPLVLMDAAIELREHALYLFVERARAGATVVYGDEDALNEDGTRVRPRFKPDASPELLRQEDYIGACVLVPATARRGEIVADLLTGATSVAAEARAAFVACDLATIEHVPHVLFHDHATRPGRLPVDAGPAIGEDDLPSVTVIVPTRDRVDLLSVCINSVLRVTDYPADRLDVVIIDNGSTDAETLEYLAAPGKPPFRVIRDPLPFNYSRLNNAAAASSRADVLVLLNNDTETTDPSWLRGLVHYAMQPDVGAVGPKLLYEDGMIQHAGVVLGIGVAAAHAHVGIAHDAPGDYGLAQRTHEVAAVTGACLAVRRTVYEEAGGLDEGLAVAFNDVDFCLRLLSRGYRNLYVHDVWMRHFESKSRGVDDTAEKVDAFIREANYTRGKLGTWFARDPYYSPNLSVMLDDFYGPAFPPRVRYPWRESAAGRRAPRVMVVGALADAANEVAVTMLRQSAFLAEQGYDVTVATPARLPGFRLGKGVREAFLPTIEAAACYAVEHDVDCIVSHTAGYAGVSRLLGDRPATILHHHGFEVEGRAVRNLDRDQKVAIRLGLPAAAAVVVSSLAAAGELEVAARLVPPGGDRLGAWSDLAKVERAAIRARHRWADLVVILVDLPDEPLRSDEAKRLREVAERLDRDKIRLVAIGGIDPAPPGYQSTPEETPQGLFAAADVLWQPNAAASPMLAAEALAYGLTVVDDRGRARDSGMVALAIAEAGSARDPDAETSRCGRLRTWPEALEPIRALIETLVRRADGEGAQAPPVAGSGEVLLAADRLILDSNLFDPDVYLAFNRDVAAEKISPWEHFLNHGGQEGRRPSHLVHTEWYLGRYPEVASARSSPLAHYLANPTGSYDPNPYFSNRAYLDANPDVAASGLAPLVHYLRFGAREGRSIGNGFDADFYSRAHSDVGASGLLPFVHFMTIGDGEGRFAVPPEPTPVDIYDDAALVALIERPIGQILPQRALASGIVDRWTAARFVLGLLRDRPDIRARFPKALSQGGDGAFALWLTGSGGETLGLHERARYFLTGLFDADYADRVRQIYLVRTDLRREVPFAMLPEGRGALLRWGLGDGGLAAGLTREELWWFITLCDEERAAALVTTYLFTPSWQVDHPAALTVFGATAFLSWIERIFGLAPAADAATLARALLPAHAIRVAYNATPAWRDEHPDAFASRPAAAALIDWLADGQAPLAAEARSWVASLDRNAIADALALPGVNMIGHFCYPSGLKTSTEALVRGCREAGLEVTERDVWVQLPGDENRHADFRGLELFDTTIILCQPEPLLDTAYVRAGLGERPVAPYRIGYWYWEQEEIPDQWFDHAAKVDEVWTSTNFVGDALKKTLAVPVRVIPHGIELEPYDCKPRSYFGLPEDHFLFLFTFHMMSVMERKNPLGLIEAFVREFDPSEKVGLVLKTSFGNHHPRQMAELRRAAAGANVTIVDAVYTKAEVLGLMDSCDAYVSLHRSEGFGLTMAEAMLVGRPTIATGYSANLDFMTPQNSLLVDYELIELDRNYPPYKAGSRWARASIPHAGQCMRSLVNDPAAARALGDRARADIRARMSFAASGRMVAARLQEIDTMRKAGKAPR